MDWIDRPQNYMGLHGILQLLQGSHLDNYPLKTLKLDWMAFHSVTFQLKCLDFQSNQYKKLAPVLSRFYNSLGIERMLLTSSNSQRDLNVMVIHVPSSLRTSSR